jgi:hypothetical protein
MLRQFALVASDVVWICDDDVRSVGRSVGLRLCYVLCYVLCCWQRKLDYCVLRPGKKNEPYYSLLSTGSNSGYLVSALSLEFCGVTPGSNGRFRFSTGSLSDARPESF